MGKEGKTFGQFHWDQEKQELWSCNFPGKIKSGNLVKKQMQVDRGHQAELPDQMVKMGRATPLSTGNNEADRVEKRRRAFEQSPLVPRKTGTLILSGNIKNLKLQNRKNENVGR
ncbi:hypothetical protein NPIL_675861 [Nephila pilipes]|uniref:Uncharacterized protein n=1 Tax=Nephila pilipes TaxID=299642 RepID=A0A8X6Q7E1_NEPPI|nr:hypothetical protein NPIL_675861 [Nephila pilipes]